MKPLTIDILLIISTVIFSFITGLFFMPFMNQFHETQATSQPIIKLSECENLSLEKSAKCMINYVKPSYNYILNSSKDNSDEFTLLNGGNCLNYAKLYTNMARNLGFASDVVIISMTGKTNHAISIIANDKEYCEIDQTQLNCVMLE